MTEQSYINVRPTIKIDGEENRDLQEALNAFVINLPLSGMAHGEISAINWITSGDDAELGYGFQRVGLGKQIEILMGENEDLLFAGEITGLEERYGSGAPQINLLIQDKLHILSRQRENRVFEDQSPDDIINEVAGELGMQADVSVSATSATYHQLNESNLAFITRLLNAYGTNVRIDQGKLRAKSEEPDSEPVELSASDSALRIRLLADLNHQPSKIMVKGFNTATNESIRQEADALDSPPEGVTAKQLSDDLNWPGENIVPMPFARSQSEAEAQAKAHFTRLAKRFVSGEIRCVGEPTLKSGREVNLNGVSNRFIGTYQVVHCTHVFNPQSGYETHIKVNRADGAS
jgi:phage protein D